MSCQVVIIRTNLSNSSSFPRLRPCLLDASVFLLDPITAQRVSRHVQMSTQPSLCSPHVTSSSAAATRTGRAQAKRKRVPSGEGCRLSRRTQFPLAPHGLTWVGLECSASRTRHTYCASPDIGRLCDDLQSPRRQQYVFAHPPTPTRCSPRLRAFGSAVILVHMARAASQPDLPGRARHSRDKKVTANMSSLHIT